jgi:hypothetical protein
MSFEEKTNGAAEDAANWSRESVELNLTTMRQMVDRAASSSYTSDQFVQDAAKLMIGAQRDMARMMDLWGQFATALQQVNLEEPNAESPSAEDSK